MVNKMDGVFVSSELIQARMVAKGIKNTMFLPLGVDPIKFHPKHNSDSLKMDYPEFSSRLNIFYPHRFSEEKGVRTLLKALDILADRQISLPQIFFAGTGPDLEMIKRAAQKWPSVHYLGFIQDPQMEYQQLLIRLPCFPNNMIQFVYSSLIPFSYAHLLVNPVF